MARLFLRTKDKKDIPFGQAASSDRGVLFYVKTNLAERSLRRYQAAIDDFSRFLATKDRTIIEGEPHHLFKPGGPLPQVRGGWRHRG